MFATGSDVYYERTATALLNTSHKPAGATEWVVSVESLEIPIAHVAADCEHLDTVCPACFDSWATDYVFLEPVCGVDA